MHLSASDIASFSTGRETILIGTRAAFGIQEPSLLLRERAELRRVFDRLVFVHGLEPALRSHIRRWGLDPAAATLHKKAFLPIWLTEQAMRGSIAVAVAPDPGQAFVGIAEEQERRLARLAFLMARGEAEIEDGLPAALEDKLVIVLKMVPDHLEGETRAAFLALIDQAGIAAVAGGLILWVAAHFVPGVNIAVLAFDVFMLSGEALRAMQALADAVVRLRAARHRSELEPIAKMLAAALAVLIVNGVLSRFLKAKKVTKGAGHADVKSGGPAKPSAPHREARQARKPEPPEKPKKQDKPKDAAKAETAKIAEELRAAAAKSEITITPALSKTAEANGMKMEGLEYRLKSTESLSRKLGDTAPADIRDTLRYTMVSEKEKLAKNAADTLSALEKQGYSVLQVKNSFKDGAPYKGVNTQLKAPDGQVFELQFHTPESFDTKQATHALYEEFRVLSPGDAKAASIQRELIKQSSVVDNPPGLADAMKAFQK